jgi:hypothetical protein
VGERGRTRRRLRELRREREARLLDLGALVYELHRQGKRAPELLQEKAAQLAVVDAEVRELEAKLEGIEFTFNRAIPQDDDTYEADALEEPADDGEPDEEREGQPVDDFEERA